MEWLANLSVKWVLVAVGFLLVGRAVTLRAGPRQPLAAAAREFIEASLIAIVAVFLVIRPFLFQAYFIPSESMRMTLIEADRILVNKLVYRFRAPQRGEILVFRPPEDRVPEPKDYIKRVIGLPGETVEVVPQRLLVDGETLIRITRQSASEIMDENYRTDASIGFTFPIRGGSARLEDGIARIAAGLDGDLKVIPISPSDRVEAREDRVLLNGEPVLQVIFGPLEESDDLAQWGGGRSLKGTVYSINGTPRLILVRGKTLELDSGHVRVDGRRLEETYLAEAPMYAMAPLPIPPDHYFMMGDNRNHSLDSHAWGPLVRRRVIGRAEVIFWPPSRLRRIH